MLDATPEQIKRDRLRLQNPYAHLNDNEGFSALAPKNEDSSSFLIAESKRVEQLNIDFPKKVTKKTLYTNQSIDQKRTEAAFESDLFTEASSKEIHHDRLLFQNQYAHISDNGNFKALKRKELSLYSTEQLRDGKKLDSFFSEKEIEEIARKFQIDLIKRFSDSSEDYEQIQQSKALDPFLALAEIGYSTQIDNELRWTTGDVGDYKVAGIIDSEKKHVIISSSFPKNVQRFTAAHELGHALLHKSIGLHRDRPRIGENTTTNRNRNEWQADKFATYFLMPCQNVNDLFTRVFGGIDHIHLTEKSAYALGFEAQNLLFSEMNINNKLKEFSRIVASTNNYFDKHFESLADQFKVSIVTMAIRLQELKLVSV